MKIRVFKFEVSNASRCALSSDVGDSWYREYRNRLYSPQEIEEEINEFCSNVDVVDVKVNEVDCDYHNNGRGNTIELWYTIVYKEQ